MESQIFRLILLIVGIALIVGIYLWDRMRRRRHRSSLAKRSHVEPVFELEQDPLDLDAPIEVPQGGAERERASSRDEFGDVSVPTVESSSTSSPLMAEEEAAMAAQEFLRADTEQKIIQIGVVAKDQHPFPGREVREVFERMNLKFGLMRLFHRYVRDEDAKHIVFSVANLFEPGNFEPARMDQTSFRGFALFMKVPGPRDGLEMFSEMLSAGQDLAAALGGELQDQNRSALTRQTIEHIREGVIEHRRRLQLADRS
jgi:cell division protein ZipA